MKCQRENRTPLRVCLISGALENEADASLMALGQHLEAGYNIRCTSLSATAPDDLPGLDALGASDVVLLYADNLTISGEQLERIKAYCAAGRPLVAVRPSIRGFVNWPEFGATVLGASFEGQSDPVWTAAVAVEPDAETHPVCSGLEPFRVRSTLYAVTALPDCTQVLMSGTTPESDENWPVTWARDHTGGRIVYSSLGDQDDLENGMVRRLLANALFWAAGRDVERRPLPPMPQRPRPEGTLHLNLRSRVEVFKGSGEWEAVALERDVPVAETAVVIVDMWDRHWDPGFTAICGEIAVRMNPVLKRVRDAGVQIIHCPSANMSFYADTPQRRRMELAPAVKPPEPLEIPDPPLPIENGHRGREGEPYTAWTREDRRLGIGLYDGIADTGEEVYSFLRQQNISTLVFMGVATNMCLINRPFAIKAMTRWGLRCVFVRDLTAPFHDAGAWPDISPEDALRMATSLVVEHIEKHWCPSITSALLVDGLP